MSSAIFFHAGNSLEFEDVRQQVLRIPEVLSQLRRAQEIWDTAGAGEVDFISILHSEDRCFFKSSSLKELVLGLVQLGLFQRYVAKNGKPRFILGNTRNESATLVATGHAKLTDLVLKSRVRGVSPDFATGGLPVLRGQLLPSYQVFELVGDVYEPLEHQSMGPDAGLRYLAEEEAIERVITIGPGNFSLRVDQHDGALATVKFQESIAMDPMLGWFWESLRGLNQTA
jgi:hypothetical protein